MDRQLLDQATKCMSMFAVYALGYLYCLQYHTEAI